MIGMDRYLNAYVDRRVTAIIDEWELATRPDTVGFSKRLKAVEMETARIQTFEQHASDKLTELEMRAKRLAGVK